MASKEELPDKMDIFETWNYDIALALRKYQLQRFQFSRNQRSSELKDLVMNSDTTAELIAKISKKENKPEEVVKKDLRAIVDEIGHNFNLLSIRVMCFLVGKVIKNIFSHIYVNKSGIAQLREIKEIAPIIFVPSHNSYFDFLLLSLVCFALDLPLPAIASGQDFLHVAIINQLFRGSGAFFMRRTFSNDECYKTIFKEYVMHLTASGDMPIEFFLEGTRSRNGKAIQPKTGLLSMVNETYYRGLSPDLYYCPVTISFECIPEENLYTYELLGLPKPKESLSGVLKSKSILSRNFGEVNLHFGMPLSLEEVSRPYIDRTLYLSPERDFPATREVINRQEASANSKMAMWLVNEQQKNMTLTSRAIVAFCLLESKWTKLSFDTLLRDCVLLVKFFKESGCKVSDDGQVTVESVKNAIDMLHPCVQLIDERSVVKVPTLLIDKSLKKSSLGRSLADEKALGAAITDVYLSQQRNKVLTHCYVPSFVCRAATLRRQQSFTLGEILEDVKFQYDLMRFELVYHPLEDLSAEVQRSLELLERLDCISKEVESGRRLYKFCNTEDANRILRFLTEVFQPFFETYWFVCQIMLSNPPSSAISQTQLANNLQLIAADFVKQGILQSHEALSCFTLKNVILYLAKSDALVTSRDANLQLVISNTKADSIAKILGRICDVTGLSRHRLSTGAKSISLQSNL